MPSDSLFCALAESQLSSAPSVTITLNDEPLHVPKASSVAAALLAAGVKRFRNSPVSGSGRGPYCMMGVCFECLLEIDGVPNRQACLVPLCAGMTIRTQDCIRGLRSDVVDMNVDLPTVEVIRGK